MLFSGFSSPLNVRINVRVFSLDLKDASESAIVTIFSREFQVLGAVLQKAHPEEVVVFVRLMASCVRNICAKNRHIR